MAKRKLQRFAENDTFPHFFQPNYKQLFDGYEMKGRWAEVFFKNQNPITLELGCGKGEFTTGLAARYPERNFIGIDIKGARLWRGAKTSLEAGMQNVAFVRSSAEHLSFIFGEREVDELWITFPDPLPNKPKTKKRLTSPQFLERYRQIAKPSAIVHLKTDNDFFFEYSLEVIHEQQLPLITCTFDLDKEAGLKEVSAIRTYYEEMFRARGATIKYLKFELK
ncbi:MAG TPA: tRNA (guanosine(46)-N7)-methyltransferase TrmB [Bacteroidales bacterium]|nr:tRNA (guanosine(46)-N7)-methyltransferase TrmB [Bacteroidales bacterium]